MEKPFLVIIDEESDTLELLQYNFMRRGIHVRTFSHPGNAHTFILDKQPDMIICDGRVTNGREAPLWIHLRKDPLSQHIPLVLTSYLAEKIVIKNALESGVTDYIVKPIKAYELVTRIEQLLVHSLQSTEVPIDNYPK